MVDPAGFSEIDSDDWWYLSRYQVATVEYVHRIVIVTVCTPGRCGQSTVPGIVGVNEKISYLSECSDVMFRIPVAVIT